MANDLIVIQEGKDLTNLYTENSIEQKLEEIKKFARSVVVGDVKTKQGSADIRTMAARVRSTKVAMEKAGKELTDAIKKKAKDELSLIEPQIDKIGIELTALAEEIRKPLTEWENAEKIRTDKHESDLSVIANCLMIPAGTTSEQMQQRIDGIEVLSEKDWEEYQEKAEKLIFEKVPELKKHRDNMRAQETIAADNAKLKKEADDLRAEIDRKNSEELQIKRDADLLQESEWREIALVSGSWIAAIIAKEKSDKMAKDAADKAAQDERDLMAAKALQAQRDEDRRKADVIHRNRIKGEVIDDLAMICALMADDAAKIIDAIAEGKIRNVCVKF